MANILTREDVVRQWDLARENIRKRNECSGHFFAGGTAKLGGKYCCMTCGAVMNLPEVALYIQGFVHAGGREDDVWPGWSRGER
jgi:hypothetical protein